MITLNKIVHFKASLNETLKDFCEVVQWNIKEGCLQHLVLSVGIRSFKTP